MIPYNHQSESWDRGLKSLGWSWKSWGWGWMFRKLSSYQWLIRSQIWPKVMVFIQLLSGLFQSSFTWLLLVFMINCDSDLINCSLKGLRFRTYLVLICWCDSEPFTYRKNYSTGFNHGEYSALKTTRAFIFRAVTRTCRCLWMRALSKSRTTCLWP
jgi:hypothetical protein